MRTFLVTFVLIAFLGCATSSGVIQVGPDTYFLSKQGGTGFANTGAMKVEAIQEGAQYCIKSNKQFQLTTSEELHPFAGKPGAEIQFMCLNPGDPDLKRGGLVPMAPVQKVIIDKTEH